MRDPKILAWFDWLFEIEDDHRWTYRIPIILLLVISTSWLACGYSHLFANSNKEIKVGIMVQKFLARNQARIKKIEDENKRIIAEVLKANNIRAEDVKNWIVDLKTGKLTFTTKNKKEEK